MGKHRIKRAVKKRTKTRRKLKVAKRVGQAETTALCDDIFCFRFRENTDLPPFVDIDTDRSQQPHQSDVHGPGCDLKMERNKHSHEPQNGHLEILYNDPLYKHFKKWEKKSRLYNYLKKQFER